MTQRVISVRDNGTDEIKGRVVALLDKRPAPHHQIGFDYVLLVDDEDEDRYRGLQPVAMTYEALGAVLQGMADLVVQGDSFEGSIEYLLPDVPEHAMLGQPAPEGFEQPDVMVRASFRIGNTMGQGGVRILGTLGAPQS